MSLSGPIGDGAAAESRFPRRVASAYVGEETLLGGLEKSRARAASFPCSKFYCWFYVRELVDRAEQLPVGHISRLFRERERVASFLAFFSFLFFRFSFLAALASLPRAFSTRCVPTCVCAFVVWPCARYRHDTRPREMKHCTRAFKGTPRCAS